MNLYVDIGNTRLKWLTGTRQGACDNDHRLAEQLSQAWFNEPAPNAIFVCCVGGQGPKTVLTSWVAAHWPRVATEIVWFSSDVQFWRLRSRYAPEELGADRWAAMIGAWAQTSGKACSIIDAGSAVTVDVVCAEGVFLGGVILPGYALMAKALNQNTDQLPIAVDINESAKERGLNARSSGVPMSTSAAIRGGIACAVEGGVCRALSLQREMLGEDMKLFFTGGDGETLRESIRHSLRSTSAGNSSLYSLISESVLEPDLVIDGLKAWALTTQS